jgi:formylglycine-generating enzyme required for sulfatase activity
VGNGVVQLADVSLPLANVTGGMALLAGSSDFVMGADNSTQWPAHHRSVPAFYLDTREVSVGDFRRSRIGPLPEKLVRPANDDALTQVTYDQALAWAENAGKCLPTETQYELAATGGNTQAFPWGASAPTALDWPIGEAGTPSYDRTTTSPTIAGLYSNAAEWTTTWFQFYPRIAALGAPAPVEPREYRVIRGAPASVVNGKPDPSEFSIGPPHRMVVSRTQFFGSVGFRCARSARPHWEAADFEAVLRDGK